MKKIIISAITSIILLLTACEGAPTSSDTYSENERPYIHGLISRINYGEHTLYLFGSMHAGDSSWYPLPARVMDAMSRADVFYFEYNLNDRMPPAMFFLPEDLTLAEYLPTDVYEQFVTNLEYLPFTYEQLYRLSVGHIWLLLRNRAILQSRVSHNLSIDLYVLGFANRRRIPVRGLTSTHIHASYILSFPKDVELDFLTNYFNAGRLSDGVREINLLADTYERQDENEIASFVSLQAPDENAGPFERYFFDIIATQRSVNFAQSIAHILTREQEPTTFFVTIGIAHMVGERDTSVFNVLSDKGFEIVHLFE